MNPDHCRDCGRCCDSQGTPPMLPDVYAALPAELKWDRVAYAARYDEGLPCLWYDEATRRCRHYDHRPAACREFEPGSDECNDFRSSIGLIQLTLKGEAK